MFRRPKAMVERLTLSAFLAFAKTFLRSRPPSPPSLSIRHFSLTHRWSSSHLCRHAIINQIMLCQDRESESPWLCGACIAWLGKVIAPLHGLPTAPCMFPTATCLGAGEESHLRPGLAIKHNSRDRTTSWTSRKKCLEAIAIVPECQ